MAACLASSITTLFYRKWWLTWGILIGSAAFDGILYLLVKDAVVCYRCQAHYRGVPAQAHHLPFELTVHERYRQEKLRREELRAKNKAASGKSEIRIPSSRRTNAEDSAKSQLRPCIAFLSALCGSSADFGDRFSDTRFRVSTVDPAQREHLRDDLKGVVKGDLLFDDLSCVLYSTDASIFEVRPLGVVLLARDEEDLQSLVRFAGEHQVPLVPRGAGTGLGGEALGAGIVVDLSKYFCEVLEIGPDTVRVQPGVVYRDLARRLAAVGRRLGPDPAHEECTLGGMVATNASGSRAFRHGYVRDHVHGLRVVLDSGDIVALHRHPRFATAETELGRLDEVVSSVFTLLHENADLIRAERPRTKFDRCGYVLHDVLDGDHLNLAHLLTGSEGTLALFTEATLRTLPLPGEARPGAVGLPVQRSTGRCELLRVTLPSEPVSCDLIDRRLLTLARSNATVADLIPASAEAVLLVEYEADTPAAATALALDAANRCRRGTPRALLALVATDPAEIRRFWEVREAAAAEPVRPARGAVRRWPSSRRCRRAGRSIAGLFAPRFKEIFAAARDDGVVPRPRRNGAGPHATVPRSDQARRRGEVMAPGRRGAYEPGCSNSAAPSSTPARHRPGTDAVVSPPNVPAPLPPCSASSSRSSTRATCFNLYPAKIVGPAAGHTGLAAAPP